MHNECTHAMYTGNYIHKDYCMIRFLFGSLRSKHSLRCLTCQNLYEITCTACVLQAVGWVVGCSIRSEIPGYPPPLCQQIPD